MTTKIVIKNAIIQYPNLFEPKAYQDSKPVFSAKVLLNKKEHKETIDEIKNLLKNICNDNKITFKPDSFKCFKDGIDTGIDSYKDYYVLNTKANADRAPKIIDRDLTPYVGTINSGAIVNIQIDFWHYNYAGISKGIACNLIAVQVTHKTNSDFTTINTFVPENTFEKLEEEELPF